MAESTMPKFDVGGGSDQGAWWRKCCWKDGVELAEAIAAKHHGLGVEILYREAKGVKFHRNFVVSSEFANRD